MADRRLELENGQIKGLVYSSVDICKAALPLAFQVMRGNNYVEGSMLAMAGELLAGITGVRSAMAFAGAQGRDRGLGTVSK